ncbi:MAG: hypothetical protein HOQ11_08415 [Gemmatimonadaceae bacterium]|nr:hypothetical protein [Gemmatimonadaceae bacterium]NUS97417.1 hypothetical protein [Gemmatimonadaceae bacterium]
MADYNCPHTPLAEVHAKVVAGDWHIRREAQIDALAVSETLSVRSCLLALTPQHFHKAMDAEEPKWKGAIQDVYKPTFQGFPLYVKFQVWPLQSRFLLVVSFKEQ